MKIISLKNLKEKHFHCLEFQGLWLELIGKPERNFKVLTYGVEKSGKSTLMIRFADYLATDFGKVFYNSHEEGFSKTLQDRLNSNNITASNLFFGHKVSFEEMMDDSFKRKYFKTIFIDSLQYMNMTYTQYKQLTDKYKNKSFVFISQINGRGKIKGGTDISHAVDVKIFTKDGYAKVQSRFAEEKTVQIFEKKKKTGHQLPIFTNP